MTIILTYLKNRKGILLFLFFLLCLKCSFSQKTAYDINDPRNPDCPCHKYQKLADEEYKQWLKKQNANSTGISLAYAKNKNSEFRAKSEIIKDKILKKPVHPFQKFNRKKRGKKFNKLRMIFGINKWNICKRFRDPSACFHWNR